MALVREGLQRDARSVSCRVAHPCYDKGPHFLFALSLCMGTGLMFFYEQVPKLPGDRVELCEWTPALSPPRCRQYSRPPFKFHCCRSPPSLLIEPNFSGGREHERRTGARVRSGPRQHIRVLGLGWRQVQRVLRCGSASPRPPLRVRNRQGIPRRRPRHGQPLPQRTS